MRHRRLPSGQSEQLLPHSRKPGPRVDTLRAAKVEIRCDRAQPVQFDGDTVEPTDRLDLEIDPSSLTLAVPEHPPGPDPPSQEELRPHRLLRCRSSTPAIPAIVSISARSRENSSWSIRSR